MNRRSLFGRMAGAIAAVVGIKKAEARTRPGFVVHAIQDDLSSGWTTVNELVQEWESEPMHTITEGFRRQTAAAFEKAIQQEEGRFK